MIFLAKNKLKPGVAYAVTTGAYVGEILVFVEKIDESYFFISIPKNINREVPIEKFDYGIKNGILDEIDKIPKDVFKLLKAQFIYNKKINNV